MRKEPISVTNFRSNMYALFDRIDKTGGELLLSRKGRLYELKEKKAPRKKNKKVNDLEKISALDIMVEDPDWYISPKLHQWSGEIDPGLS